MSGIGWKIYLPKLESNNRIGFGVNFGKRFKKTAVELSFFRTTHQTSHLFEKVSDALFNGIGVIGGGGIAFYLKCGLSFHGGITFCFIDYKNAESLSNRYIDNAGILSVAGWQTFLGMSYIFK